MDTSSQTSNVVPIAFAQAIRGMRAAKDPRLTTVLLLAHDRGWTYEILAQMLGVSHQAVKSRAGRADGVVTAGLPAIPVPLPRRREMPARGGSCSSDRTYPNDYARCGGSRRRSAVTRRPMASGAGSARTTH